MTKPAYKPAALLHWHWAGRASWCPCRCSSWGARGSRIRAARESPASASAILKPSRRARGDYFFFFFAAGAFLATAFLATAFLATAFLATAFFAGGEAFLAGAGGEADGA